MTSSAEADRPGGPAAAAAIRDQDVVSQLLETASVESRFSSVLESTVQDEPPKKRRDEARELERLTAVETKHVKTSRSLFLLTVLMAASIVTMMGYAVFNNKLRDQFKLDFLLSCETLRAATKFQLDTVTKATTSESNLITAQAVETTSSLWPFVTLQTYEVTAGQSRRTSGAEWVGYAPLLQSSKITNLVKEWESYSSTNGPGWIEKSYEIEKLNITEADLAIPPIVYRFKESGSSMIPVDETGDMGMVAPLWQMSPPPQNAAGINFNGMSVAWLQTAYDALTTGGALAAMSDATLAVQMLSLTTAADNKQQSSPISSLVVPIYEVYRDPSSAMVGMVMSMLPFSSYLEQALPHPVAGVQAVLRDSCTSEAIATYQLAGSKAQFHDTGDMHNELYDELEFVISLDPSDTANHTVGLVAPPPSDDDKEGAAEVGAVATPNSTTGCYYWFSVYPTEEFESAYQGDLTPLGAAALVAGILLFLAIAFFIMEHHVNLKMEKIFAAAVKSNTIISTLFPANVRDRLFAAQGEKDKNDESELKKLLGIETGEDGDEDDEDSESEIFKGAPIADLFPEVTILFADLMGFTAWSSVREPSQVFTLLETLYHSFDVIAEKRNVFKVETVGDCYVAVTGLPEPQPDHAIIMCRFASDCMRRMNELLLNLEVELGPDTADLNMRFGLHSGSVTAGVLRGQRSRFQLFGDTMNTASRIETTCLRGRIQLSADTAGLLVSAGKSHWIKKREETVFAKGKGDMQTYWLESTQTTKSSAGSTAAMSVTSDWASEGATSEQDFLVDALAEVGDDPKVKALGSEKTLRLINWTVELLRKLLKQIAARRRAVSMPPPMPDDMHKLVYMRDEDRTVVEEVREVIHLPTFDPKLAHDVQQLGDPNKVIDLGREVEKQLQMFVTEVASMYRAECAFHNFEHVSHVVMSVSKFLSRIVPPADLATPRSKVAAAKEAPNRGARRVDKDLKKFMKSIAHEAVGSYVRDQKRANRKKKVTKDHTFGITSDPLTQFACVLSALIHDVDHTGVPNSQLIKENPSLAAIYKSRSVAEQLSVDLTWGRLMDDDYAELRAAIYSTESELKRFRQLVVNCVMATDIMDKELKSYRSARWDKAFPTEPSTALGGNQELVNRKATIVIEHIMQAADISHTMQHWHVYRKWNEKLFREMSLAYVEGRADKDPADDWYQGEIGFFDFYVIPLAKNLKDCGVFGVASSECLNYALLNRQEWELRGREAVAEMAEAFRADLDNNGTIAAASKSSLDEAAGVQVLSGGRNAPVLLHRGRSFYAQDLSGFK